VNLHCRPHIEATINGPSSTHVNLIESFDDLADTVIVTSIVKNTVCKETTTVTSTSTKTTTETETSTTRTTTTNSCPDGVDGYARIGNLRHSTNADRILVVKQIAGLGECAKVCSSRLMCTFFVYNRGNLVCHGFSSTPTTKGNNGFIAYDRLYNCDQTTTTTGVTTTATQTTSCEGLLGYDKIGNRRHKEGNLFTLAKSVASARKCAEICSSAADCSYFVYGQDRRVCFQFLGTPSTRTNNGFLAYSLRLDCAVSSAPTSTRVTSTTVVPPTAPTINNCPVNVEGYNGFGGLRHTDNKKRIRVTNGYTANKCARLCSATAQCSYFVFGGSNNVCSQFSSTPPTKASASFVAYGRKYNCEVVTTTTEQARGGGALTTLSSSTTTTTTINSCPNGVSGYKKIGNRQHTGTEDLIAGVTGVTSVNRCAQSCSSTSSCSYFIFRLSRSVCLQFSSTPTTKVKTGFVAYARLPHC
jgi:hypothetical protein